MKLSGVIDQRKKYLFELVNFSIRAHGGATSQFERFSQNGFDQPRAPLYLDTYLLKVPSKSFKLSFELKKKLVNSILHEI